MRVTAAAWSRAVRSTEASASRHSGWSRRPAFERSFATASRNRSTLRGAAASGSHAATATSNAAVPGFPRASAALAVTVWVPGGNEGVLDRRPAGRRRAVAEVLRRRCRGRRRRRRRRARPRRGSRPPSWKRDVHAAVKLPAASVASAGVNSTETFGAESRRTGSRTPLGVRSARSIRNSVRPGAGSLGRSTAPRSTVRPASVGPRRAGSRRRPGRAAARSQRGRRSPPSAGRRAREGREPWPRHGGGHAIGSCPVSGRAPCGRTATPSRRPSRRVRARLSSGTAAPATTARSRAGRPTAASRTSPAASRGTPTRPPWRPRSGPSSR